VECHSCPLVQPLLTSGLMSSESGGVVSANVTTATRVGAIVPPERHRKKSTRSRRKRGNELQMPKLTYVNYELDAEVVECQLETTKHSNITFKFNLYADTPEDIARNMVSCCTRVCARTYVCVVTVR